MIFSSQNVCVLNRPRHKLNTNITTAERVSMGQCKAKHWSTARVQHTCRPRRRRFSCLCCRCLEFLLQSGATASLEDKQGYRPIHYAAAYGHKHCLELVRKHSHKSHTQTHICFQILHSIRHYLHCNQVK